MSLCLLNAGDLRLLKEGGELPLPLRHVRDRVLALTTGSELGLYLGMPIR